MDGISSCVSKFVSFLLQVVDPTKIPVYCEGKRVKELGRIRLGTMATLVNRNCIICSRNELSPVMVWFGSGGVAPCVRGAAGEVVEEGKDKASTRSHEFLTTNCVRWIGGRALLFKEGLAKTGAS